jgi:hypothetical protein
MENNRIAKQIAAYKPRERRSLGRPLKRWQRTVNRPHGLIPDRMLIVIVFI